MNFKECKELFAKARNPAAGKPVQNNTRLFQRADDCYSIRFHDTDVVTIFANDTISLDTNGWFTMSTKDRICGYAPVQITSVRGVWYVEHELARKRALKAVAKEFGIEQHLNDGGYMSSWAFSTGEDGKGYDSGLHRKFYAYVSGRCRVPYFDGIMFDKRGRCLNGLDPRVWRQYELYRESMTKRIQTYCTAYNRAMGKGISFRDDDERLTDDATPAVALDLMEAKSYPPSLAWEAVLRKGYTQMGIEIHLRMDYTTQTIGGRGFKVTDGSMGGNLVRRALRDLLFDLLLPAPPSPRGDQRAPIRAANTNF